MSLEKIKLCDGSIVIVDPEDVSLVHRYKWRYSECTRKKYVRNGYGQLLHRLILGAEEGQIVDHINGDTLDCRKCNLRLATNQGNARNQRKRNGQKITSEFKGVSVVDSSRARPYRASIRDDKGKQRHIGYFKTDVEAAFAYDVASTMYHGEFGKRNFLPLC